MSLTDSKYTMGKCPAKWKCQFTAICLIFGLPIALIGMMVLAGDGYAHLRDFANAVEDECRYTGEFRTEVCTACDRYIRSGSRRTCAEYCTNTGIKAYYDIISKETCPDGLGTVSVECLCSDDPYEPKNYDGEWHACYIADSDFCDVWSWTSYEEGQAMFYGGIAGGVVVIITWGICLCLCRRYRKQHLSGDDWESGGGGGTKPAYESNWQ